jgi:hypothetical protein
LEYKLHTLKGENEMTSIVIKEKLSKDTVRFDEVKNKAADIEALRQDFYVKDVAKNLWMDSSDGAISFCHNTPAGLETENMAATGWALSQLSVKLGMPSGYAEKCIQRGHPDLAADNVNTWLTEQNGSKRKKSTDYLVRAYDGKIDGILSSGYTAFDTTKILGVLERTIDVKDYHVVGSYISDERMHLRLIRDELLDVDDEDLYPGIFIDSSDVGRTALHISFGIWKKVCTNGLCISKVGGVLYHQRHMGITPIEVETEMVARIKAIPQLITRSEDIIKSARAEKIDFKDEKVFERMMNDIRRLSKVSEEDAKKVIELSQLRYGATRWGVVNAMTEVAQNFELDDRIRIENAAGRLIAI